MLSGMGQQAVSAPRSDEDVRAILERLDGEIERRDVYISARQRSIDSLRNHLRTSPRDLEAWEWLGRAYTSFDNDSAINVIDHAQRLAAGAGDSIAALRLRLRRAQLRPHLQRLNLHAVLHVQHEVHRRLRARALGVKAS